MRKLIGKETNNTVRLLQVNKYYQRKQTHHIKQRLHFAT